MTVSDLNGATPVPANGANHSPANGASPESPKQDAPPEWFQSFAANVEKRISDLDNGLGKRFENFLEKKSAKKEPVETTKAQSSEAVISRAEIREEMNAAMRFGEVRGSLNQDGRELVDEMVKDGMPYSKAITIAERLAKATSPAKETVETVRTAPPGVAATPAPRTSHLEYPKSQAEYFSLATQAAERESHGPNKGAPTAKAQQAARLKAELDKDPMFSPEDLPRR